MTLLCEGMWKKEETFRLLSSQTNVLHVVDMENLILICIIYFFYAVKVKIF